MPCSRIVTDSVSDIKEIAAVLGYFCMQVSDALRERQMSALGCSTSSVADASEPAAYQSSLSGAQARAPSCCVRPKALPLNQNLIEKELEVQCPHEHA